MKLKLLVVFASVVIALAGHAQGTAFTYQGRLNDGGNPANGSYDFTFTIFGTNHGGTPITQTITNMSVSVSDGLFTSTLDFGNFLNGNPAWLEIGVRSNGNGSFTILVPRQQLAPTPYAMFANTASNVIGQINGDLIAPGTIGSSQLATGVVGVAQLSPDAANDLLTLQVLSSTNLQAVGNSSYLFTNTAANQITLPADPNIGDRVRISGGAGGFTVIANGGQSIYSLPNFTWTPQGAIDRYSVASSSNGSNLYVAKFSGGVLISRDNGLTWTQQTNAGLTDLQCIASSGDGHQVVVGQYNGYLYASTNYGLSWNQLANAGFGFWFSIASSSNGSSLLAGGNHEFVSTNSGTTWTYNTANLGSGYGGPSAAMSSDGRVLYDGTIVSTNNGATWTYYAGGSPIEQAYVTCSSDGNDVLAAQGTGTTGTYAEPSDGYLYISTNEGVNWTRNVAAGSNNWQCVAMNSNGTKLAAGQFGGYLYTSTNSGATWTQQTAAGAGNWVSVALSDDGSELIAGQSNGHFYVRPNYITQRSTAYVYGSAYANLELVYAGNGLWVPSFCTGNFSIQ